MLPVSEILNYTTEDIIKNITIMELGMLMSRFTSLEVFLKEYKEDARDDGEEFFTISNYLKLI